MSEASQAVVCGVERVALPFPLPSPPLRSLICFASVFQPAFSAFFPHRTAWCQVITGLSSYVCAAVDLVRFKMHD